MEDHELDDWPRQSSSISREPSLEARDSQSHSRESEPSVGRTPSTNTRSSNSSSHNGLLSLSRTFRSLDVFMIGLCAVIGMGFYVRTGTILNTGGPAAVVYSFAFLGLLAFMITQCLTTMLRLWPIAGALIVFIEKFVDKEVSEVAAILYWLTYCFSFAALTTTLGELMDYYDPPTYGSVLIIFASLLPPIILNLIPIRVFRCFETKFGFFKLLLALTMIITMNVINPTVGEQVQEREVIPDRVSNYTAISVFQHETRWGGWFTAILAGIFLASYAFIGIEGIAVAAQEVRFSDGPDQTTEEPINENEDRQAQNDYYEDDDNPFELSALLPLVVTVIYMWGGWTVSQNVSWDDSRLPSLNQADEGSKTDRNPNSVFIISIETYVNSHGKSRGMSYAYNALLILNVASTLATALYIASRTLYGFSLSIIRDDPVAEDNDLGARRLFSCIAKRLFLFLARREPRSAGGNLNLPVPILIARLLCCTSRWKIPWVSVVASSLPSFLTLTRFGSYNTYLNAIAVVSEMASVSCFCIWALVCLAAFRFYRCYKKYYAKARPPGNPRIPFKKTIRVNNKLWYYTRLVVSLGSAILCCLIIVAGAFTFLLNPNASQGVAIFLIPVLFLVATIVLKCFKKQAGPYKWSSIRTGVDLDDAYQREKTFKDLQNEMKHNNEGED